MPKILQAMDVSILHFLNGLARDHDWFEDLLRFVAIDAQYVFVGLLGALFLARGRWGSAQGRRAAVAAVASMGLALALGHLIAGAVDRPRPYVAHPASVQLFVDRSADPSFPSDHATAAFAIAVAVLLRMRRVGLAALAVAALLAVARVVVGVHYPSDVLAGALLGAGAALLLWVPPARELLDRLADWLAGIYDRLVARAVRRPLPSSG